MKQLSRRIKGRMVILVIVGFALIASACEFPFVWSYIPLEEIDPEVDSVARAYIAASRSGDVETVALLSMFFESGEFRPFDKKELEQAMKASSAFWNYTEYTFDAAYIPRRTSRGTWRIVFTLYYASGNSTTNEIVIQRLDGQWKVTRESLDPKLLRSLGE